MTKPTQGMPDFREIRDTLRDANPLLPMTEEEEAAEEEAIGAAEAIWSALASRTN